MKKNDLEDTEENLLSTMERDTIGRNSELVDFLLFLDNIDGNYSIALDGEWGSGKTFLVKQLKILLEYFRKEQMDGKLYDETQEKIKEIVEKHFVDLNLEKTYASIYYDAWLYDDHPDALLSLIYSFLGEGDKKENLKALLTDYHLGDKVRNVIKMIISHKTGIDFDLDGLLDTSSIMDTIYSLEEVKEVFRVLVSRSIEEKADRLVVFIDELDRCKPDFAIDVLEKLKHFVDDDRVVFLYSLNKEQLSHTIEKFYGYNFNATIYLNRFFDFNFSLKKINPNAYITLLNSQVEVEECISKIYVEIGAYFKFSLREYNTYYHKIIMLRERTQEDFHEYYTIKMIFASIVWGLEITNVVQMKKFVSGKSADILEAVYNSVNEIRELAQTLFDCYKENADTLAELTNVYTYIFGMEKGKIKPDNIPLDEDTVNAIYEFIVKPI